MNYRNAQSCSDIPALFFIESLKRRGTEIQTPWGQVKILPPESIGGVPPELAEESTERRIETLLKRPREVPAGVAEIFVGRDTISRGSGFVISTNGYVISDINVLGEAKEVLVRLAHEDDVRPAKVIAKSPGTFLALLQLAEGTYPTLRLASSVSSGESVYKASLKSGISRGVVTGLETSIKLQARGGEIMLDDTIITSSLSV